MKNINVETDRNVRQTPKEGKTDVGGLTSEGFARWRRRRRPNGEVSAEWADSLLNFDFMRRGDGYCGEKNNKSAAYRRKGERDNTGGRERDIRVTGAEGSH